MKKIYISVLAVIIYFSAPVNSEKYKIEAYIETVKKNGNASILFRKKPENAKYNIIFEDRVIGSAEILNSVPVKMNNWKYRSSAEISVENESDMPKVKAGNEVVLTLPPPDKFEIIDSLKIRKNTYMKKIITRSDSREMILVPEGKFYLGSNDGDPDEKPVKAVYVPAFYLDKYEVSNADYRKYILSTNSQPPQSWENGSYNESEADLPVYVTFFEAVAYAKWAGKRLPSEQEWEKAAKGTGGLTEDSEINIYPWEGKFNPEKANCAEFWASEETGKAVKQKYSKTKPDLLPVNTFEEVNSPYGHVNLAGNASEWTSSWYLPYSGNRIQDRKYGKQYKVIRGGNFTTGRKGLRASNRELGGTPNLYKDNSAGFRCAKDVFSQDKE